jgi:VanZ family protein
MANRLTAWVPAAAWAGLLFFLSSLPDVPGPRGIPYGDKVGHFVLYAVLGACLSFGRARSGWALPHALVLAVGALYGLSDEWHQMFVPGRTPDLADWVADVAGLLTGYVVIIRGCRARDAQNERKGTA